MLGQYNDLQSGSLQVPVNFARIFCVDLRRTLRLVDSAQATPELLRVVLVDSLRIPNCQTPSLKLELALPALEKGACPVDAGHCTRR